MTLQIVVSTAKVQKIWEQFTTWVLPLRRSRQLFRLQKYKKFESNSQHPCPTGWRLFVVSTAKVQKIWEQFTTQQLRLFNLLRLFRLQKYKKFESNSQLTTSVTPTAHSCFDCKSTKNLRAIHNIRPCGAAVIHVVSTAKVQKIWEQFTTPHM